MLSPGNSCQAVCILNSTELKSSVWSGASYVAHIILRQINSEWDDTLKLSRFFFSVSFILSHNKQIEIEEIEDTQSSTLIFLMERCQCEQTTVDKHICLFSY